MEAPHHGIDRYLLRLVQENVRKVIGKFGFTKDDCADLEQDLLAHVLMRLPQYDPKRGAKATFYANLVRNRLRNILDAREFEMRTMPRGSALNAPIDDGDGGLIERLDLLGDEDYLEALGRLREPSENLRDLQIDLRRAIESLPGPLQELCLLLLTESISQAARKLDLNRSTIYKRIRKIRTRFLRRGIGNYA